MRRRTICHAMNFGGIGPGSFIPSLASLAAEARRRGDRFVVLAREVPGATWPPLLTDAGAELYVSRKRLPLYRRLWDIKPDIVHTHFSAFDIGASLFGGTRRVFWHVHSERDPSNGVDIRKLRSFIKNRLVGMRVEAFITPSHSLGRELSDWFMPDHKVRVVLNGIDTHHFRPPTPDERTSARHTLGIQPTDRVVLFFERIPFKGGDLLRTALQETRDLRLLVTGGPEKLRARFSTLPNVVSISYEPDVRRLYWAADVLAFPSIKEAFGFVLLEARSCNLPVVASNIPSVREVTAGLTGVTRLDPTDSAAFAAALSNVSTAGRPARASNDVERLGNERWSREIYALYDRT